MITAAGHARSMSISRRCGKSSAPRAGRSRRCAAWGTACGMEYEKRIFKRMMAMCALVLVFSMAAVAMFTYHYFEQRSLSMLKSDAVYIARAVEAEGAAYFDGFSAENRITWIAEDGSVLYESDGEAASMENHADRPEVQQARREGEGSAIRQSSTLSSKTLYYACCWRMAAYCASLAGRRASTACSSTCMSCCSSSPCACCCLG